MAAVLAVAGLLACGTALYAFMSGGLHEPAPSTFELKGSTAQRIAQVTKVLHVEGGALPTPLADAHLVEETVGEAGGIGPVDYVTYIHIAVPPEGVEAWLRLLTPTSRPENAGGPRKPASWWITPDRLPSLEFYEPWPLSGRRSGWIGVSRSTGRSTSRPAPPECRVSVAAPPQPPQLTNSTKLPAGSRTKTRSAP